MVIKYTLFKNISLYCTTVDFQILFYRRDSTYVNNVNYYYPTILWRLVSGEHVVFVHVIGILVLAMDYGISLKNIYQQSFIAS